MNAYSFNKNAGEKISCTKRFKIYEEWEVMNYFSNYHLMDTYFFKYKKEEGRQVGGHSHRQMNPLYRAIRLSTATHLGTTELI